jgi:heat-inducible transcriptional repressor
MTERQKKLLQAIINEFIESAEAVGSVNLVNRYHLDISSATIRNEMMELMRQGYLSKPHSSAGRIPTTQGYKLFVDDVMLDPETLDVSLSTLLREELFKNRFDLDELIYTALNELVEQTGNVSMALVNNRIYHAGLARVPTQPEFKQVQGLCNMIQVIEDRQLLQEILGRNNKRDKVRVIFGEDTGLDVFQDVVIIYSLINLHDGVTGYLGVIGPQRMDYAKVIPTVDFIAANINRMVSGW